MFVMHTDCVTVCFAQGGNTQSCWSSLDWNTQVELNSFCVSNLWAFNFNLGGCLEVMRGLHVLDPCINPAC